MLLLFPSIIDESMSCSGMASYMPPFMSIKLVFMPPSSPSRLLFIASSYCIGLFMLPPSRLRKLESMAWVPEAGSPWNMFPSRPIRLVSPTGVSTGC